MRRARTAVDDAVHGAAPAPYAALDLIEGSRSWTLEEGYRREEEAIADLILSRQAQASLYAFDLVERRAKRGVGIPDAKPRPVQKVGIVGAGLMATQLATLFLRRLEVPIVMRDIDAGRVESALEAVRDGLPANRYDEGKRRFLGSLVTGSTELDAFEGCDFVLEAVFEELAVKKQVLRRARGDRLARVHLRHQHLVALGDRDGRRPRASRSGSSGCTSSTRSR